MKEPTSGRPGLLAFDVDGTLLDSTGTLHHRTAAALQHARQLGIPVAIATGRPWLVVERTVEKVGGADYVICSNGSMLVDMASGNVHRNIFLPDHRPRVIVAALRAALGGIGLAFEFEHGAKSEPGWDRRLPAGVELGRPVDDVLVLLEQDRGSVRKVIAYHDNFDTDIPALAALAQQAVGDNEAVLHSGLPFVEVGVANEHKAAALEQLAEILAVQQADVMAFGDDVNDIEMLSWAGTGVAMGNAADAAKASADVIAATNDEHGVAQYLEEIFQ